MLNQTRYLQNYTWNDLDQDIELHLLLELIWMRDQWTKTSRLGTKKWTENQNDRYELIGASRDLRIRADRSDVWSPTSATNIGITKILVKYEADFWKTRTILKINSNYSNWPKDLFELIVKFPFPIKFLSCPGFQNNFFSQFGKLVRESSIRSAQDPGQPTCRPSGVWIPETELRPKLTNRRSRIKLYDRNFPWVKKTRRFERL